MLHSATRDIVKARAVVIGAVALACAVNAHGQWTYIDLHPAGAFYSLALGVSATHEVGAADNAGARWSGNAGSYTELSYGSIGSGAIGTDQDQSVGYAIVDEFKQTRGAILWNGTSPLNLTPDTSYDATIEDVHLGQQVGYAYIGSGIAASLWTGTQQSWVNLNPPSSDSAGLYSVFAGRQGGSALFSDVWHAGFWRGTPNSFVDLHPLVAESSAVWTISEDQEAGSAVIGGDYRACFWSGTANSRVDLHPIGSLHSNVYGIHEGQQVGTYLDANADDRGRIWYGSPDVYEEFTAPGADHVDVRDIFDTGDTTRVVGFIALDGHYPIRAALWVRQNTPVAPTSYSMFRGSVVSGNLSSLLSSDGDRLVMRPGPVFSNAEAPIQIIIQSASPQASPKMLSFQVEANTSIGNAEMNISMYNFVTGQYDRFETHPATTTDSEQRVNVTGNVSDYIEVGTLKVRGRVTFRALGPVFVWPWLARIDRARWILPGT